ncbi:MAG: 50S ribosomal protein L24 [Planctomycetota bacterium]|nr:50S ribosomal protein L24 [Planctomycetota bacterium]MDI6786909.1 50S ribosomal protein L24 [Planctomycetota bacterium]
MFVKKNDTVKVICGESRGKTGKIIRVFPRTERVVVQGVNLRWKHMRRSQQYPRGARIQKEMPVHISNVKLICPQCNKPTRVGYKIAEGGVKNRICKKCLQIIAET